jgi:glucokinase
VTPAGPAAAGGVVVAVDVGGTAIKGLLVDADGQVRGSADRPTPRAEGPDAVVAGIRATVGDLVTTAASAGEAVRAVGVAVPGEVDPDAGIARYSANLGWRDVPGTAFTAGVVDGVPVVLDHDVRSAAVAELAVGRARGVAEACLVVIGTGIASVGITRGEPVVGARGLAGELGHVPVRPGGEPCACGQFGCLETYASAAAVARRHRAAGGAALEAHEVVAAAVAGDVLAARVWDEAVQALGTALVSVTMLTDPELVVLAGGLAEAGDALLDPLRAAVAAGLAWRPPPRIEISPLGGRAGRHGIALRAWAAVPSP